MSEREVAHFLLLLLAPAIASLDVDPSEMRLTGRSVAGTRDDRGSNIQRNADRGIGAFAYKVANSSP